MADALSIVAIIVSILSFGWSLWIENKLERQATARYAFDAMIATPIEGKLQQFESLCDDLAASALQHSNRAKRSSELQALVRRRFNSWYFSTDALLQAAPTKKTEGLVELLESLPDELLTPINNMSMATSLSQVDGLAAEVVTAGTRFIAGMRAQVHETRLSY